MSSYFLPFLSSLLRPLSTNTNANQRITHLTIRDQDRGGFTTPERQQDHISYHDTGLRGTSGANIVLRALADNPFAQKLTLSHNFLGDLGCRQLASRANAQIRELNLASNEITDDGLASLLHHWFAPRQQGCHCTSASLTELYLSNNRITLATTPSPLLFLHHLTVLSLTSNPIESGSLIALFRNPAFAPKALTTLHLSACRLDTPVAFALAGWLEDPTRAGKLEWLAVNGNNWGTLGCERIVWALARPNGNKNLLRVEMLACVNSAAPQEIGGSEELDISELEAMDEFGSAEERDQRREVIESEGGWKALLERCGLRNQVFRLATRRAALGIIAAARVVLISSPGPKRTGYKGWEKLPDEIQFEIWRWVGLLSAFPGLAQHPLLPSSPLPSLKNIHEPRPEIPEPLTTVQLSHVLAYAADRRTLYEEVLARRKLELELEGRLTGASAHRRMVESRRLDDEADRIGQELVLKACQTQRFDGRI
ncbi:hypothetical protein CROQUDRAFT_669570 [Cronartium quercuum f. sp. fusiforme G11]|uniref:RNI-like protein n=1 Tax=Cronartium quercuum f. sp. fusiforme G11 TaxID=708437 RepID=A0A9P6NKT8_9BASI|nr:hypothetical protein CROQUDRAFT_669570 [Cronartium quercuum f. sp. fusiforme G11]